MEAVKMSYTISIVKDKFSNNEEQIYKTILNSSENINLIIQLIKRIDDLEQHIEEIDSIFKCRL
jgi:hypothetical protein